MDFIYCADVGFEEICEGLWRMFGGGGGVELDEGEDGGWEGGGGVEGECMCETA